MTRRPTSCSSAATASSSRSAQPTTRPIWSAARWVARAWTRKRSGFSSQPPLDSKKSKTGRGAGDRQHAGGLQHVDRLGDAGDAAGDEAAAVGEAQHGDRERDVGLDRFDDLADPGGLGGRGARSPARATRSGPGSARPPRRPRRGGCRAAAAPREPLLAPPRGRRPSCACFAVCRSCVDGRGRHDRHNSSAERTFGLAERTRGMTAHRIRLIASAFGSRKPLERRRRSAPATPPGPAPRATRRSPARPCCR